MSLCSGVSLYFESHDVASIVLANPFYIVWGAWRMCEFVQVVEIVKCKHRACKGNATQVVVLCRAYHVFLSQYNCELFHRVT